MLTTHVPGFVKLYGTLRGKKHIFYFLNSGFKNSNCYRHERFTHRIAYLNYYIQWAASH